MSSSCIFNSCSQMNSRSVKIEACGVWARVGGCVVLLFVIYVALSTFSSALHQWVWRRPRPSVPWLWGQTAAITSDATIVSSSGTHGRLCSSFVCLHLLLSLPLSLCFFLLPKSTISLCTFPNLWLLQSWAFLLWDGVITVRVCP